MCRSFARAIALLATLLVFAGCTGVLPVPVVIPAAESGGDASVAEVDDTEVSNAVSPSETTPETTPADELPAGGSTPEEAVENYMLGIIEGNLDAVLDASARRDIARKYEFVRYVQRLRSLPVYQALMPPNDDFAVELNEARSEAQIASQVTTFVWSLLARGMVDVETGISGPLDEAWAADVVPLLDMSRLGGIELTEIAPPDPQIMASERYQENAATIAEVYGADEYTEMVATFTFEGNEYQVGFQLLRYGDQWYVLSQSSPLAGTPGSGAAVEVEQ